MTAHGRESGDDSHAEELAGLVERLQGLHRQAVDAFTPEVESILQTGCQDIDHIEHTLDALLSCCWHEDILALYRRLCRHYWAIDPLAAAGYVEAYRETWGDEDEDEAGSQGGHTGD